MLNKIKIDVVLIFKAKEMKEEEDEVEWAGPERKKRNGRPSQMLSETKGNGKREVCRGKEVQKEVAHAHA